MTSLFMKQKHPELWEHLKSSEVRLCFWNKRSRMCREMGTVDNRFWRESILRQLQERNKTQTHGFQDLVFQSKVLESTNQ